MTIPDYWKIAYHVCTAKELAALELRERHGYGSRITALALGISRATVRERLENADRKITLHLATKETTP